MDKYKYYCDKCQYGTNIRNSFDVHNKSTLHLTGKKKCKPKKEKYKCEECEFTTNKTTNFLSHKLNNHSSVEERKEKFKYYCSVCDFGTFAESNFEKHKKLTKHIRMEKHILAQNNNTK
jgi:hypothetical protein